MTVKARNALHLLVGLSIVTTNASAVTDLHQNENGDYVGELDPVQDYDIMSLPIDGAVRASDIEGCEFKGQPKAYGYNGVGYTKPLIHGSRGNALHLEDSCEFTIDKDDIIDDEPRDIDSNEWFVFSPTEERRLEDLYANNGCTVNGLDGYPVYQVDTSGNQPMEVGVLEGEKSYWLRLQGQNCEVDFLESTTDISVQIDSPSERLVADNQYEVTVSADSESEGLSRIELLDESKSCSSSTPSSSTPIPYSCEKTFQYTPDVTGKRALTASVYNLASEQEQERVVLAIDSQDEEAVDPESGDEEESTTDTGELRFELFDAEGDQMSGGSINVEGVGHSRPKDFSSSISEVINVPKGEVLSVSIKCNDAELNTNIELGSNAKNVELLLAEPSFGTLCSQYGGGFSVRSEQGEFDVREGDPRTEPVTLGTAEYRFSVVNGGQRIPFEKVPDQVSSFEQDRAYELLFSVKAYRPGTSSTVDVFDGDVKMSVQGPDDATNYNCGGGVSHRCNTPAFAETFDSGDYTVEVTELAGPSGNEIPIEQSKVTLPEVSYGSGYY